MKPPVVNLGEEFGKVVGANVTGATDYDRLVDAAEQIMPRLPFPKGVYRFSSFEEADAWTEHYILKAAREKNRARTVREKDIPDRAFLRGLLELRSDRVDERRPHSRFQRIRRLFAM